MTSSASKLAKIIAQARLVLLDFDGPVCSIFGGLSAPSVATHLQGMMTRQGVPVPSTVTDSDDPFDVLRFAATLDFRLATQIEAELHHMELRAIRSAPPTPHAIDAINACHDAGWSISIVSNNSRDAVERYIKDHDLTDVIHSVIGRTDPNPALLKPNPHLILRAIKELQADPANCVLVGDSISDVHAAHNAGIPCIGFANKPGKHQRLTRAGADTVIVSMAELSARS